MRKWLFTKTKSLPDIVMPQMYPVYSLHVNILYDEYQYIHSIDQNYTKYWINKNQISMTALVFGMYTTILARYANTCEKFVMALEFSPGDHNN